MRSTSSEGLSAAVTAKDPADFQLRFKDIASNHEHRQGKFEIFTPERTSKSYIDYPTRRGFAQGKTSHAMKFFWSDPIDNAIASLWSLAVRASHSPSSPFVFASRNVFLTRPTFKASER
jgi:hypothetical protein